jgi:uncharacterized membrane protein
MVTASKAAKEPTMSHPTGKSTARQESPLFLPGCIVLGFTVVACGVFAYLAGKEIGNQNVDFGISFALLGVVVVMIFGLAWIDTSTKSGDHDFMQGH